MKYLIALVVVVALIAWLRSKRRPPARSGEAGGGTRPAPATTEKSDPAPMLRCAFCGLHIPGSEALRLGAAAYCSEDHRRRHGAPSDV